MKFSVTYIFRRIHEKIPFGMVLITHFSLSELQVHCYKLSPSVKSLFSKAEVYAEGRNTRFPLKSSGLKANYF